MPSRLIPPQLGSSSKEARLERIQASPNFKKGRFRNPVETTLNLGVGKMSRVAGTYIKGIKDRVPKKPVPTEQINLVDLENADQQITYVTWLGHSAVLVEMEGLRILCDPMLGRRASPFDWSGPKRFDMKAPITLEDFPKLDAIIISHDHYDHLDYESIVKLHGKTDLIFTSLGVGAHLEYWGVPAEKIIEFDWWEEAELGHLKITAAPSRHFSGRRGIDSFKTLWSSWAIKGRNRNIFFGADSGYYPGFAEIAERLGPFDLSMLECGAYGIAWPYIHMFPEQTAQAHRDLNSELLLPIHWGAFSLAPHSWTEPIERLYAANGANGSDINIATPLIGQRFALGEAPLENFWWRIV